MIAQRESLLGLVAEPRNEAGLPAAALAHFHRGNAFYLQGDFASAIQEDDAALAVQPRFAEAHCNRGVAFLELELFEDALAAFKQAIKLEPGIAVFHTGLGAALVGLRRYEEALDTLQRSIELDPKFAATHASYASALLGLKRYEEAFKAIERAMALSSKRQKRVFMAAVYQEALAAIGKTKALGSDTEGPRAFKAEILKKLLRGLASGGRAAWLGSAPLGARRPLRLKRGSPTVAEAIIEDRR